MDELQCTLECGGLIRKADWHSDALVCLRMAHKLGFESFFRFDRYLPITGISALSGEDCCFYEWVDTCLHSEYVVWIFHRDGVECTVIDTKSEFSIFLWVKKDRCRSRGKCLLYENGGVLLVDLRLSSLGSARYGADLNDIVLGIRSMRCEVTLI